MRGSSAEQDFRREFCVHVAALADAGFDFSGTPEIVCALPGGRTNHNFLIQDACATYVLRVANPASVELGICRDRERTLLALAADAGLAPAHLCSVGELGLDLFEYLSGRTPSPLELAKVATAAAEVLHTVHRLQAPAAPFDYATHLCRLAGRSPAAQVTKAMQILSAQGTRALVHHDPNPSNWRLGTTGLKLIDWEYAALGFAEVDWAALMVEARLPAADVVHLSRCSEAALFAGRTLYMALGEAWQKRILLIAAASKPQPETAYSTGVKSDPESPASPTVSSQTTLLH